MFDSLVRDESPDLGVVVLEKGKEIITAKIENRAILVPRGYANAIGSLPKVSCVTVTKDRLEFVKSSIDRLPGYGKIRSFVAKRLFQFILNYSLVKIPKSQTYSSLIIGLLL